MPICIITVISLAHGQCPGDVGTGQWARRWARGEGQRALYTAAGVNGIQARNDGELRSTDGITNVACIAYGGFIGQIYHLC